ncbi:MAG: site-specific DNA-methyltransferase [Bacillota bacterium]|nr:site-specific DNA-methyltransferase [Bacillota bacterium]
MHTRHNIIYQDSRNLSTLSDDSIDLVVTSPPYPMIEMWDEQFKQIDPNIGYFLQRGDYSNAFEAMHNILDEVWSELFRVMKSGAFACINIGDATRTINKRFQLFANHSRVQKKFFDIGFDVLPLILWRKQTNAPNKFMGSGMLPAGAYVTLEHEYILIFRKGNKRIFATPEEKHNRMLSSFFWEERNTWFSDIWDFKGTRQQTNHKELRSRSAAFPFLLPFRLINMYSVFGDTVLDPFLGTGTSTLSAMAAGRDSIGYEVDKSFSIPINKRIGEEKYKLNDYNLDRISNHINFVQIYTKEKGDLKYTNNYFGFPVMTKQETELKLAFFRSIEEKDNYFKVSYADDNFIKSLNPNGLLREQLQNINEVQQSLSF